ncbi:MAG: ABC transporter substrate-binding protein [Bacteroidales bacterium]|nr:MAG: ABC transporter substrate-binding protein [Bacteroidales bacterium]
MNNVVNRSFFLIILGAILFGCNTRNIKDQSKRDTISVSILPQKYLIDRLTDSTIEVNVMVPPGSSPEMYEPSPVQMKGISTSAIYFAVGPLEFESSILPRIKELNPNIHFVNLSNGINLIAGHEHQEIMGEGEHHTCYDPHIWTSTLEFKQMATVTCNELCRLFPERKVQFEANLTKLEGEVDKLDSLVRLVVAEATTKRFLIYHPALSYFAREFGLTQIAIEEDGKNPSAQQLAELVNVGRVENLRSVFIQSQFDSRNAEILAKELGGEVLSIDPLGYDWMANMYDLTYKMAKALNSKWK